MRSYFDSSAVIAVYVNERFSARARAELRKQTSIPWTPLHDVEVRNSLRLLRARDHIDSGELAGLLAHIEDDLESGRLERPEMDLAAVLRSAERLSEIHAVRTRSRTLDILHIAALMQLECSRLVSGDERQIAMAKGEKIRTVDIRA